MENPKEINLTSIDDSQLWDMLRSGNKSALENIYLRNSQKMFAYGMTMIANDTLVKDCIHEVFLNIWRHRERLGATNNVRLYLLRSLNNKIKRELARENKILVDVQPESLPEYRLKELAIDEQIASECDSIIKRKIHKAIENLPSRQKEIVQLLFFEGFNYDEITEIMNISLPSAYTLLWKAIKSIKKQIIVFLFILIL